MEEERHESEQEPRPDATESAPEESGTAEERLPEVLPILPVRNTVLFPSVLTPMIATTERARNLVDEALAGDRLVVVVAARESDTEEPGADDLYAVGTAVRILRMVKTPEGAHRLLVQGMRRVAIRA
jgi:ATP-dependent Lon protease